MVPNDQADDDEDGIGDACDETPFTGDMVAGSNSLWGYESAPTGAPASSSGTRCKIQQFVQRYDQFGKTWLNFLTYEGMFRVCYNQNGGGIVSYSDVHGDASSTRIPWTWKGNDNGYPYGVKTSAHTVDFHYRGTAAICIFTKGCGPEKHPWVRITFRDNNTMEVRAGVA